MEGHLEWVMEHAGYYRGWVVGKTQRVHPDAVAFMGPDDLWYGRAWNGAHWAVYYGSTLRYMKRQALEIVPPP